MTSLSAETIHTVIHYHCVCDHGDVDIRSEVGRERRRWSRQLGHSHNESLNEHIRCSLPRDARRQFRQVRRGAERAHWLSRDRRRFRSDGRPEAPVADYSSRSSEQGKSSPETLASANKRAVRPSSLRQHDMGYDHDGLKMPCCPLTRFGFHLNLLRIQVIFWGVRGKARLENLSGPLLPYSLSSL